MRRDRPQASRRQGYSEPPDPRLLRRRGSGSFQVADSGPRCRVGVRNVSSPHLGRDLPRCALGEDGCWRRMAARPARATRRVASAASGPPAGRGSGGRHVRALTRLGMLICRIEYFARGYMYARTVIPADPSPDFHRRAIQPFPSYNREPSFLPIRIGPPACLRSAGRTRIKRFCAPGPPIGLGLRTSDGLRGLDLVLHVRRQRYGRKDGIRPPGGCITAEWPTLTSVDICHSELVRQVRHVHVAVFRLLVERYAAMTRACTAAGRVSGRPG